jgi:tetratricopeptide (TPR) repeat protein
LDPACLPDTPGLELLNPMGAEATKLYNEKKHGEAETLALKILDLAPNHRMALRVLFEVRRGENKPRAAEILARRLAGLPAENAGQGAASHLQLAQLLVGQGKHSEAEPAASAALKLSPRDATIQHVMGVILTETGRLAAGEKHYRAALALLERDDGMVLANLAWNLKLQGRLNEAGGLYERALRLQPDNARGIGGFAQVAAASGNLPRAMQLLDEALTRFPADRTLRLLRALMDLQAGRAEAVLARLEGAPETLMPAELSARGQAMARLNRPADAVAAHALGKRLQRERYNQRYEPEEFVKKAEKYKTWFTADRLSALPRATRAQDPQPIFLLGFPRSGTSLAEQLLGHIPGFAMADGFVPVSELAALVPQPAGHGEYPEALTETLIGDGQDIPNRLRLEYHARLEALGLVQGKIFVTDRAADNHWNLGLIKLLFPDAPVIHLLRHPYDLLLSNFAQDRKLEANCGVSLLALARHYDFTMSLIQHYRGQLTLRYLPLRYEDLCARPAKTLRELAGFFGADPNTVPEDAVLRANAPPLPPRAPGHTIMREPVYARSLYRYHETLAVLPNLFNEVRGILEPWVTALGYEDVR